MSALALKLLALVTMTLDHIGFLVKDVNYLRLIGRIAFPIYAFLMTSGFLHTRSRTKYALRMLLFAVLSQIPFVLCFYSKDARNGEYLAHLNMMVTLLISFLVMWIHDAARGDKLLYTIAWLVTGAVLSVYFFGIVHSDYGARCILLVLVFYYFKDKPVQMCILVFFALFSQVIFDYLKQVVLLLLGTPQTFKLPDTWTQKQLCAMFALLPILLYNGKKGWSPKSKAGSKLMQLGFYAYYPVHLAILVLIFKR